MAQEKPGLSLANQITTLKQAGGEGHRKIRKSKEPSQARQTKRSERKASAGGWSGNSWPVPATFEV